MADGVYLVRSRGWGKPVPLGEFAVRGGRPELRMNNGAVVLMDERLAVRAQLDASYHPAPPVRPPTEQAIQGHSRMAGYAKKPILVFLTPEEAPRAVYDAERGFLKFGTSFAAADSSPSSQPSQQFVSAAALFEGAASGPPPSWASSDPSEPTLHPDEAAKDGRRAS
jgi:hypothetical protein